MRLNTLQRRGILMPVFGQFAVQPTVAEDPFAIAHALTMRLGRDAIITGAVAMQCLGGTGDWAERFGVTKPMAYLPLRSHLRVTGARLLRSQFDGTVVRRRGLRLADSTTSLLDCITFAPKSQREGLVDFLLQQNWIERSLIEERVAARCQSHRGRQSSAGQRAARRHAADGTESAAERLLRAALVRAGLKRGGAQGWKANLTVQVPRGSSVRAAGSATRHTKGADRLRTARLDFAWMDCRVAVEVDGRAFHSATDAFENDRARRMDLQAAGWTVLNVTWMALKESSAAVTSQIQTILTQTRRAQSGIGRPFEKNSNR